MVVGVDGMVGAVAVVGVVGVVEDVGVHSGAKLHAVLPHSKNIEAGILKKIKSP